MAKEIQIANMTFTMDKVVAKMKRCLDKKHYATYGKYPAIEIQTGLMIATEGHIMVAHKLQGYSFQLSNDATISKPVMVPVETLQMNGKVTISVKNNGYETITTATDEFKTTATLRSSDDYCGWRGAVPCNVGNAIVVDAKAWSNVAKEIAPRGMEKEHIIQVYGEEDSKQISIRLYDAINDEAVMMKNIGVPDLSYKVSAYFDIKLFRSLLMFNPKLMFFQDSTRGLLFINDDTLMLLMPLLVDAEKITVPDAKVLHFDIDTWIKSKSQSASKLKVNIPQGKPQPQVQPIHEPTLAEQLADALRSLLVRQAA